MEFTEASKAKEKKKSCAVGCANPKTVRRGSPPKASESPRQDPRDTTRLLSALDPANSRPHSLFSQYHLALSQGLLPPEYPGFYIPRIWDTHRLHASELRGKTVTGLSSIIVRETLGHRKTQYLIQTGRISVWRKYLISKNHIYGLLAVV